MIRGFPNVETLRDKLAQSSRKIGSEPGEVKHFSTQRKRKIYFIPLVVASEKGRAQTNYRITLRLMRKSQ